MAGGAVVGSQVKETAASRVLPFQRQGVPGTLPTLAPCGGVHRASCRQDVRGRNDVEAGARGRTRPGRVVGAEAHLADLGHVAHAGHERDGSTVGHVRGMLRGLAHPGRARPAGVLADLRGGHRAAPPVEALVGEGAHERLRRDRRAAHDLALWRDRGIPEDHGEEVALGGIGRRALGGLAGSEDGTVAAEVLVRPDVVALRGGVHVEQAMARPPRDGRARPCTRSRRSSWRTATMPPSDAEAPVAQPAKTSSPPKSGRTMVPGSLSVTAG